MTDRVAVAANSAWYISNFRDGLLREMQARGYRPVVIAPTDESIDDRFGNDVDRIAFPLDRSGMNPIADLNLLRAYVSVLSRSRPVALLSFTVKPNIYGAIAARIRKVPAIPTISGLGTAFIRGGLLKSVVTRLYRIALRRCPTVFFENPNDRDLFVAEGIVDARQCKVVPGSGIDLARFGATPIPSGPAAFLLVARLLGDKGVREFVEAARAVRKDQPELRFQLLGGLDAGNRSRISRGELEGWAAEGAIEYLGETDDVRPFIANASAVVLPSYREGLPRSLLEGAAMARPLIATDVPGCRELVAEGVNGFLCDARSAMSLAQALRRAAGCSREQLSEMGRRGRDMVEARFDERMVVGEYLSALEAARVPRRMQQQ